MSHVKRVAQPQRKSGLCACRKHWKRPGQGNCKVCHALAQKVYRARMKSVVETAARIVMRRAAERARP